MADGFAAQSLAHPRQTTSQIRREREKLCRSRRLPSQSQTGTQGPSLDIRNPRRIGISPACDAKVVALDSVHHDTADMEVFFSVIFFHHTFLIVAFSALASRQDRIQLHPHLMQTSCTESV